MKKCISKIKIRKLKTSSGKEMIRIENNLCPDFDKLANIIIDVFRDKGIEDIYYATYSEKSRKDGTLTFYIRKDIPKNKYNLAIPIINNIKETLEKIDIENDLVEVVRANCSLSRYYPQINVIELSEEFMKNYELTENQVVNLIDFERGIVKNCCVKLNSSLSGNYFVLGSTYRNIFNDSKKIYLQKKKHVLFSKVAIQNVNDIYEGFVTISEEHKSWIEECGCEEFELRNEVTGASIDISKDKIKFSKIEKNIIKLNYFHRLVLEVIVPKQISKYYFEKFREQLEKDSNKWNILKKYFENEQAITKDLLKENGDFYLIIKNIEKILNDCGYPRLVLYPIKSSPFKKNECLISKLVDKILDFLIGNIRITLKCIRPYETDESSNVVRLSKSTLELLGIDETDNVVIRYRGNRIKARALVIDDIEAIKDTNLLFTDSEVNVCIGIPAYLRHQLGLDSINVCCVVERDKVYLFRKNLNIQFMSILATIITIKQAFGTNSLLGNLLILAFIPFSLYISLSGVRNRIKNK
ncbi:hypothetical protein [Caldicellulosiruptor acetigenus]|uniref:Uncharacterized protein n=1 Tax=Caldicellulosiruptor acetigenus 6A TaxID=632516 RepID=G2PUB9_9FIRM|nr:hypothetical protein [Caldicellulosiruptor acetigenus]AEM73511.1 hypothetical protein Calla_0860 [Caldicellulosiruptor acetigenus 6A]